MKVYSIACEGLKWENICGWVCGASAAMTAKAGEGTGHHPSQASGAMAPVGVGGLGTQI